VDHAFVSAAQVCVGHANAAVLDLCLTSDITSVTIRPVYHLATIIEACMALAKDVV